MSQRLIATSGIRAWSNSSPIRLVMVLLGVVAIGCGRASPPAEETVERTEHSLISSLTVRLSRIYIGKNPGEGFYNGGVDFHGWSTAPTLPIWQCPNPPPTVGGDWVPPPEGKPIDPLFKCVPPSDVHPEIMGIGQLVQGSHQVFKLAPIPPGTSQIPVTVSFVDNTRSSHNFDWHFTVDASTGAVAADPIQGEAHAETRGANGEYSCAQGPDDWMLCWQIDAPVCVPSAEICDGKDNNCNGSVDEQFPFTVNCGGGGVCAGSQTFTCVDGVPGATACTGVTAPTPEIFDGYDNDCDGPVDECDAPQASWDCTVANYNFIGCNGLPGHAACSSSGAGTCLPFEPDKGGDHVCDGVDIDCDGQIDEDFVVGAPTNQATCGVGACRRPEIYTACVAGTPSKSCTEGTPTPEIVGDAIDNDCDGLVDECSPGSTDWHCCSNTGQTNLEFNVVPNTPVNSDPIPAPACLPLSVSPNGTCSLRGVFQVAAADNGCTVVAHVAHGTYPVGEELRLDRGALRLIGVDGDPDVVRVTTTASCENQDCALCAGADCACTNLLDCSCAGPDCTLACVAPGPGQGECGRRTCSKNATHRLINAIFAHGRPPELQATNSLELNGISFDGGGIDTLASFRSDTAGGGVVVDGGSFIGTNIVIADNRARGHGAGLAVYNSPLLRLTDSVVRDNLNTQDLVPATAQVACHSDTGGGQTAFSGGIHSSAVARTEITSSAIIRNVAADGGGLGVFARGPAILTMVNSTVSGNSAAGRGGGILLASGDGVSTVSADLEFNTLTANIAGAGDSILTDPYRKAGGGIFTDSGTLSAFGNIMAANTAHSVVASSDDCHVGTGVTVGGVGFNLIGWGGKDCVALGVPAAGTLIGGAETFPLDPRLFGLPAFNSGARTEVHQLRTGSLAIDAYPLPGALPAGAPACPGWDQRSHLRPTAGSCDLGSCEVGGVPDADHDGIPGTLDPQPLLFSGDFNDVGQFGVTSGKIVDRGNQTLLFADAAGLQDGVVITARAGGGATPAQVSGCGGTVNLTLQAGQSATLTCPVAAHSCLFAASGQALTVKDRSAVMSDFFGGSFNLGSDAVANANGFTTGNGSLGDRATVLGNATLAGVLGGNRAGVKGVLREHAMVAAQSITTRPGTSSGSDLTVAASGSTTIQPGTYGAVVVQLEGTLVLAKAGLYRFRTLQFDRDTRLSVLGGQNLTALAVDGTVAFGDRFKMDSGGGPRLQQPQVLLYTSGATVNVGFDTALVGTLEAPAAAVTLQDRSTFSGCVAGRSVVVGIDVTVGSGAPAKMCDGSDRVNNPGFEAATTGWRPSTGATLATTTSRARTGTRSGQVGNRTGATQGAIYNLLATAPRGATYDVSVWAEPSTTTSQPLTLAARVRCNGGQDQMIQLAQTTGKSTAWTRLAGVLTVPNCPLGALEITAAGPAAGVGLFVDDASVIQRCP